MSIELMGPRRIELRIPRVLASSHYHVHKLVNEVFYH